MSPIREYICDPKEAQRAVAYMVAGLENATYRPIVAFDVETSPIAGLEGYPGTTFDEAGEPIKAKKRDFLEYTVDRWFVFFDQDRLAELGLVPPTKFVGNVRPGYPAKQAWKDFRDAVEQADLQQIRGAVWSETAAAGYFARAEQELAENGALQQELAGKKGKKAAVNALEARAARLRWELGKRERVFEGIREPLDVRFLLHLPLVGVDNRIRIDPVKPGLDPFSSELFTLQFTLARPTGELRSWVFNAQMCGKEVFEPLLALGKTVEYVAHNAQFDLRHLMVWYGLDVAGLMKVPRNVMCTRVYSRGLFAGIKKMRHALKDAAKRFLKVEMAKEVRATFIGVRRQHPTPEQIEYGSIDTELLIPLLDKQRELAARRDQEEILKEFSKNSWVTAYWEARGFPIDQTEWGEIAKTTTTERDRLAAQLEDLLLPDNYRALFKAAQSGDVSPDELSDEDAEAINEIAATFDESDIDPEVDSRIVPDVRQGALIRISQTALVAKRLAEKTGPRVVAEAFPEGKLSLGKDARGAWERAYKAHNKGETHPFFRLYELWAAKSKQATTYGLRFLWAQHPITGRIHAQFRLIGTDTWRMAGTAPNLLNIPAGKQEGDPDYRGAFKTLPGKRLVGGDLDAFELRVAGNISRDEVVKQMVLANADPHSFSAAQMFHIRRGNVATVTKVKESFKYGTDTYKIWVFVVPESWTPQQISELALSKEMAEAIKGGPPKGLSKEEEEVWWADFKKRDPDLAAVWKKAPTRTLAKMVTFLWLFRGTAFTLSVRTGLPLEQCEDAFYRFEKIYVKMNGHMNHLSKLTLTRATVGGDGQLYTYGEAFGGLRRWFVLPKSPQRHEFPDGFAGERQFWAAQKEYERRIRSIQRQAANVPMQGGNATVTARVINRVVEHGLPHGILPFLVIYDEFILEFPDTMDPEEVKELLESVVLSQCALYMDFLPAGFEVDVKKAGDKWVKS